eukprot:6710507-Prymnesium_polylepis.1
MVRSCSAALVCELCGGSSLLADWALPYRSSRRSVSTRRLRVSRVNPCASVCCARRVRRLRPAARSRPIGIACPAGAGTAALASV